MGEIPRPKRTHVLLKTNAVVDFKGAKCRVVDGCLLIGDTYDDPDVVYAAGEWIRAWHGPAPS